ncbi:hypothetical protein AAUPMC_11741 [Pasteurella multocida subsp. multocida str. Anand1_cattle]|nr:hypothetical protein AAUPMC_11741 [Pasteurella multocida subsp. multocida str. Anand1_cattle]
MASLPDIKQETLESLLNVIASSMLAVTYVFRCRLWWRRLPLPRMGQPHEPRIW